MDGTPREPLQVERAEILAGGHGCAGGVGQFGALCLGNGLGDDVGLSLASTARSFL